MPMGGGNLTMSTGGHRLPLRSPSGIFLLVPGLIWCPGFSREASYDPMAVKAPCCLSYLRPCNLSEGTVFFGWHFSPNPFLAPWLSSILISHLESPLHYPEGPSFIWSTGKSGSANGISKKCCVYSVTRSYCLSLSGLKGQQDLEKCFISTRYMLPLRQWAPAWPRMGRRGTDSGFHLYISVWKFHPPILCTMWSYFCKRKREREWWVEKRI